MNSDSADPAKAFVIDAPGGWGRVRLCRYGMFLFNKNDFYIGRSLDLYGEYSLGEADVMCRLLRPGDVFVDIGANIGALTVPMARKVGPTGAGYAFEPQRLNFQMLCANLALNGFTVVSARNVGVSDAMGEMQVPLVNPQMTDNYGDIRLSVEPGAESESVAVVTLDSLNLSRCRLIKIDVQGMERQVLEGARATIARCRPMMVVENDVRAKSPELIRYLWDLKYRLWWHKPALFNPQNFRNNSENVFPEIASLNLLCAPIESEFQLGGWEIKSADEWGFKSD